MDLRHTDHDAVKEWLAESRDCAREHAERMNSLVKDGSIGQGPIRGLANSHVELCTIVSEFLELFDDIWSHDRVALQHAFERLDKRGPSR